MNRRIIIIGVAIIFGIIILLFLSFNARQSQTENRNVKPPSKVPEPPKIEQQIPYTPGSVNLENVVGKDLPKELPTFNTSGVASESLSVSQIQNLAGSFGFGSVSEKRPNYGGGNTYIYEDTQGRVLAVTDNPPSVDYSELPSQTQEKNNLSLDEAKAKAMDLVSKMQPALPSNWRTGIIRAIYLSGGGSSAAEVNDITNADLTEVTLGYFYNGYKVLDVKGRSEFFRLIFGNNGVVVSAKGELLINNPNLAINKLQNVPAKSLEEVSASFYNGVAKAVSLNLSGTVSDEPIINPPTNVSVNDLETCLVLSTGKLIPYYFISTTGTLSSGRAGRVNYLVPAGN